VGWLPSSVSPDVDSIRPARALLWEGHYNRFLGSLRIAPINGRVFWFLTYMLHAQLEDRSSAPALSVPDGLAYFF